MPSYRLRDAAVLVGAVVVGAAAGFNGGWLAAVPPKAEVETANKLATSTGNGATAPTASERQAPAATEARPVRVVGPVQQTSGVTNQQTVAPVPAQPLDDVTVPASPPAQSNAATTPAVTSPAPPPQQAQAVTPAAGISAEPRGQVAIVDTEPRTTGQSAGTPSVTKKNTQKVTAKVKRKDQKLRELDSDETTGQRVGADRSSQKSAQKAKGKEQEIREVEVDEAEADSEPVAERGRVIVRSDRQREYRRVPAGDYARGRVIVQGDRYGHVVIERQPARETSYEEPRRGFGLFELFER